MELVQNVSSGMDNNPADFVDAATNMHQTEDVTL